MPGAYRRERLRGSAASKIGCVLGFFNAHREGKRVTKKVLTKIADQFQNWLTGRSEKWGAPIIEPPEGDDDESRRNKFVEKYFRDAEPNQVVAILKAREPARILVAIGDKDNDSPHLEYKQRWVNQFNFYVSDPHWGRMFVRMCPYFPFSAQVCLHQRVLEVQQSGAPARTGRLAHYAGPAASAARNGSLHPILLR
jgi:hypothetical protein